MRPQRRRLAVAAALGIVYVVWGSTYLGIAVAIETLPPLAMASVRFLIAGALLYAVATRFGDRTGDRPRPRQWLAAFATGAPLFFVGNGGVAWAQQTVPSGIAALLIASVSLWIALLDRVLFGRRLGVGAVAGLVVGFGGVALLVGPTGGGDVPLAGALTLVLASLGWALGTLLTRSAALPARPLVAASMQMLAGGAVLAVVAAATGELGAIRPEAFSGRSLLALAYLIGFGSILAFSCYAWLVRATRTSVVATYAYVNPVVAVLLGWAVLGEQVAGRTLVAGGVIVAAVALIVSTPQAKRRVHSASASSTERSRSRSDSSTSRPSTKTSPARATSN